MSADTIFYPETTADNPKLEQFQLLILDCDERERRIVMDLINSFIDSRIPHAKS